jgi:VIT1/CCC1 family predicted Fe2+/Mn2+ transporter
MYHHTLHRHRDIQGGTARAAVFGVSDGLVSNVALILGVAGASTDASWVRVAGLSGLLAGAISMAAGEWVSVKAQNELIERELEVERRAIATQPEAEAAELAAIYRMRGLAPLHAQRVADGVMQNPEVALEVHAREELGIDPHGLGSPAGAAGASFAAFSVGAVLPLLPWFFGGGNAAVLASVVIGVVAATVVGVLLARFTERSVVRTVARQVGVAAVACAATYAIGSAVGVSV